MRKKVTDKEIRQLVVERLRRLPSGKRVAIGGGQTYSSDELIQQVEQGSDIGEKIIEVELKFLRAMKNEDFYE